MARSSLTPLVFLIVTVAANAGDATGVHWPSFRGPNASGVAEGYPLPTTWNVPTGENVKWKTPISGLGHASPVIWGDRIFVSSAISSAGDPYLRVGLYGESPDHPEDVDHQYKLYCLDKSSGKILWERTALTAHPRVKRHIKATHANCTPTTDGKYVVAFFGSQGLYCYDMRGELVWKKDMGLFDAGPADAPGLQWGFASSPVIHDGRLYVTCAARNVSFVAAYDLKSGSEIWKTDRPLYPGWHSPGIYTGKAGPAQLVTNGFMHIGGYDLVTGKELWKMHGGGDVPVPTPIFAHDLIYITNAHGAKSPVYAIKPTAKGDITLAGKDRTNDHIQWSHPKTGNYMQTPLVYGDYLFTCRDSGIFACYNAKTGKKQYKKRLDSGVGFTASPVAGDGKVYFTSEEGDVHVLKVGDKFERLSTNPMGEITMATPAISEGILYFHTKGHLVAIGN
jgi:outer membrane protein assembly factor BamB